MIKLTREMVNEMGKEITGIEKGKTCSVKTFRKVNNIMNRLYGVMSTVYDTESIDPDTTVVFTFGSRKKIKIMAKDNKLILTNKKRDEIKGKIIWIPTVYNSFRSVALKKITGLNIEKFLQKVTAELFKQCEESNDYVIYEIPVSKSIDDKLAENLLFGNEEKVSYSISNLKEIEKKVNIVKIIGCYEDNIFSDILAKLDIPLNYNVVIINDNRVIFYDKNQYFDEGPFKIETLKEDNIPLIIIPNQPDFKLVVIKYNNSFDIDLIKFTNIENLAEVSIIDLVPSDSKISDEYYDYVYVYEFETFRPIKDRNNDHLFIREQDLFKLASDVNVDELSKPGEPAPQIILSPYLTEKAIELFTKQRQNIINNYNIFKPNLRNYAELFKESPTFMNIFSESTLLDTQKFNFDIDIDATTKLGTIKLKNTAYKEVIERMSQCTWGPINDGCFVITEFIDENNKYYPYLKVYTQDTTSYNKINHVEIWLDNQLVKTVYYYGIGDFYLPHSLVCTYYNKDGFDSIIECYAYSKVSRQYELDHKQYKKDDCAYSSHIKLNQVHVNEAEKQKHLCQDLLVKYYK